MFFCLLLFRMRQNHFADIGACPQIQLYHSETYFWRKSSSYFSLGNPGNWTCCLIYHFDFWKYCFIPFYFKIKDFISSSLVCSGRWLSGWWRVAFSIQTSRLSYGSGPELDNLHVKSQKVQTTKKWIRSRIEFKKIPSVSIYIKVEGLH